MPVVWTIEERCKRCYTCIRECPAKAINVEKGQAKVIEQRCVGCGHCVRVCTQQAKAVLSGLENVDRFLRNDELVIAMLAPSFVAAFPDGDPDRIVGALRSSGFKRVVEVAFGADVVNRAYVDLARRTKLGQAPEVETPFITTSCPAINHYVSKYLPGLVPNLAPIVSPMIAMGRIAKQMYGESAKTVFIGPCAAKKLEMRDPEVAGAVDEVLTFSEMEKLFADNGVSMEAEEPSSFDPPHPNLARMYPISGGLIRSSGLPFDIMDNEIIVTEGKQRSLKLLECLQDREITANMVDVLFCEGCISGPFMNHSSNHFTRKKRVVEYTEAKRAQTNDEEWQHAMEENAGVDVRRVFSSQHVASVQPTPTDLLAIFSRINKHGASDELNCGACGYDSCREYATAVFQGFAEEEMCSPFLIDKLQKTQHELTSSLRDLADMQEQLVQTEKLASVGQLAAGVAHEVNNPLGSIMLFSHIILQQLDAADPKARDVKFIIDEATRCQKIVSGLLNFARQGRLALQRTSIVPLIDRILAAIEKHPVFSNIRITVDCDETAPELEMDTDQIYQVLLNLVMNAGESMPDGGALTLRVRQRADALMIQCVDTGCGIPPEHKAKIFTPFFTTKQIGKGTGLGLAIAYGIIKMHRGNITVESAVGKGTTFTIELPVNSEK